MKNTTELPLRLDYAEKEIASFLDGIVSRYDLPYYLLEPIVDKMHRIIKDTKNMELAAARKRSAESRHSTSDTNETEDST